MSTGRKVGAIFIAVLLVGSVFGANLVNTTQSTALNDEFVITQMDEAGVYGELSDRAREEITEDLGNASIERSEEVPDAITVGEVDAESVAEDAVTEEFIATRFEEQIRQVFAYLNGESDELNLTINVEPVKEEIGTTIGEQNIEVDAAEIVGEGSQGLSGTGVPINQRNAERMIESEQGFQAVTEDYRQDVREDVRQETGASGDELDQAVDEALEEANQEAKAEIRNNTEAQTSQYSDNVTDATTQMQFAMVDALTDDSVTYDQFNDRIETQEEALAEEAGRLAVQQVDDRINDDISLGDYMGSDTEQQIEGAPSTVGQVNTLGIVLPILSLLFVGLVYVLTRSIRTTALYTGISLVVSALLGLAVAFVLRAAILSRVRAALPPDQPDAIGDAVIGLARGILGTLSAQSLVLLVVGIVLVALAVADSKGFLDPVKERVAEMR